MPEDGDGFPSHGKLAPKPGTAKLSELDRRISTVECVVLAAGVVEECGTTGAVHESVASFQKYVVEDLCDDYRMSTSSAGVSEQSHNKSSLSSRKSIVRAAGGVNIYSALAKAAPVHANPASLAT